MARILSPICAVCDNEGMGLARRVPETLRDHRERAAIPLCYRMDGRQEFESPGRANHSNISPAFLRGFTFTLTCEFFPF